MSSRMVLANAESVETDVRDVQLQGRAIAVHRQCVVAVQPGDPSLAGSPVAGRFIATLVGDPFSNEVASFVVPAAHSALVESLSLTMLLPTLPINPLDLGSAAAAAAQISIYFDTGDGVTPIATITSNLDAASTNAFIDYPMAGVMRWTFPLGVAMSAGEAIRVAYSGVTTAHFTSVTATTRGRLGELEA